jgi:ribosomal protein S18 acetylase RimI-like enzyme
MIAAIKDSISPVRIRAATAADMPAMIPVVNAAFAIETFLDGTRTDEERMAEMMRKGEFLVAEIIAEEIADGVAKAGAAVKGARSIVAAVYTELRGERGYFGMLSVDPSRQGTGLGRVMVEAAEDYCRKHGCKYVDIVVLSLRPDLPPFYRKLGYIQTGTEAVRTSRPLKDGVECHGITMSKVL